jgi:hypothetical protein
VSDPKSPLQRVWHGASLLFVISIVLTIALWLISQIWWIVLILIAAVGLLYGGFLWLRDRRGRW